MGRMNRLLDETMIFALCLPAFAWSLAGWESVVSVLFAAIATAAFELARPMLARSIIAAALAIACALVGPLMPFLPIASYLCMAQHAWLVRCLWPACWVFGFALTAGESGLWAVVFIESCVAAALAVRTARIDETLLALRESRDAVKESLIELVEREGARVEAAEVEAGGDGVAAQEMHSGSERLLRFSDLTERENTVVSLIAQGCENKEIAARLYLSEGTVRNVVSSILQKKGLANRTQIAIMYYRD